MSSEMSTLGAFATVQGGYAYKSQDFNSTGGWSVLKIKNVRNGHVSYNDTSFVSNEIATATSKWATKPGDILISMTGSGPSAPESLVGRVARVWKGEKSALINQRVGRLVLKDEAKLDPDFLFYLLSLKENQDYLVSNSTGSANQVNISAKTIESVPCPKIDHSTSSNIASILLTLDKRIRLLRETNNTLESIAQALFKSWFVDFDPVRAKQEGREPEGMEADTAALFPDSFEESELGLVPKGWRVGMLGEEVKIAYGKNLPTTKLLSSGYPVFGGNGQIGFFDKYLYETRQVLVACRGAASGKVNQSSPRAFVTNNSLILESNDATLLSFGYLKGYMVRSDLTPFVTGSAQPQVTIDNLKNFKILIPSTAVLKDYELLFSPIENKIEENNRQAQTLATLRDTLLPRLISGQLRLPDAEALIEEATA